MYTHTHTYTRARTHAHMHTHTNKHCYKDEGKRNKTVDMLTCQMWSSTDSYPTSHTPVTTLLTPTPAVTHQPLHYSLLSQQSHTSHHPTHSYPSSHTPVTTLLTPTPAVTHQSLPYSPSFHSFTAGRSLAWPRLALKSSLQAVLHSAAVLRHASRERRTVEWRLWRSNRCSSSISGIRHLTADWAVLVEPASACTFRGSR